MDVATQYIQKFCDNLNPKKSLISPAENWIMEDPLSNYLSIAYAAGAYQCMIAGSITLTQDAYYYGIYNMIKWYDQNMKYLGKGSPKLEEYLILYKNDKELLKQRIIKDYQLHYQIKVS